jgi:hypothetical protein
VKLNNNIKMKNLNKIILIIILTITIVGGWYFYQKEKNTQLQYVFEKEGINLFEMHNFIIEKDLIKERTLKERIILAKNKENDLVKARIVYDLGEDQAREYINEQSIILTNLYEPVPPPYPEFIGQEVSCDSKYKPLKKEHSLGEYYLLYAGDRYGYGVCEDKEIKYKTFLSYFYLKDLKKIIKLEYFTSKYNDFNQIETILR